MRTTTPISFQRTVVPACLLLALTTGCGSDDSALTKAEYQRAANAVCAEAEPKMAAIFEKIFPNIDTATEQERQAAADEMVAIVKKELDDLDALVPPSEMTDDVDAMLVAARKGENVFREQGADLWLDDSDPFVDANQRAATLGLDACAGDPGE